MRLTGQQFENLQIALLSAYRSESDLARMVRFSLDENLHSIAGGSNLSQVTFDLIQWAESNGRLDDLISGAYRSNPGNPDIVNFRDFSWPDTKPTDSQTTPNLQEPPQRRLTAFLCHSSADKSIIRKLFVQLRSDGVEPWLDEENLLPGQNWRVEIPKAVRSSDVVLICLSKEALGRDGYVQDEIRFALEEAEQQDGIFLIPVRLDNVKIPNRLSHLQWVDLFDKQGYAKLINSLEQRAINLDTIVPELKSEFIIPSSLIPLNTRIQWQKVASVFLAVLTTTSIIVALVAGLLAILDRFRDEGNLAPTQATEFMSSPPATIAVTLSVRETLTSAAVISTSISTNPLEGDDSSTSTIETRSPEINSGNQESFSIGECVDFESLELDRTFNVGDSFTESGVKITTGDFQWSNGTLFSGGFAKVVAGGLMGHEMIVNNIVLQLEFDEDIQGLTLQFGEFGGNLNLEVNGEFKNFGLFSELDAIVIDGVNVSVRNGFGNDQGLLRLSGNIHSFAIGGQELIIDNICLSP